MRKVFSIILLLLPAISDAQWIGVSTATVSGDMQAINIDSASLFAVSDHRVVALETVYKKGSRKIQKTDGEAAIYVDRSFDIFEVNCAQGTYRYLVRSVLQSNNQFFAQFERSNPAWTLSLAKDDPSGWFMRTCALPVVRAIDKAKIVYGAAAVKAVEQDREMVMLMELDGERVSLSVSASDCDAGFGVLRQAGRTVSEIQAVMSGEKQEDGIFKLTCLLGKYPLAHLKSRMDEAGVAARERLENEENVRILKDRLLENMLRRRE